MPVLVDSVEDRLRLQLGDIIIRTISMQAEIEKLQLALADAKARLGDKEE